MRRGWIGGWALAALAGSFVGGQVQADENEKETPRDQEVIIVVTPESADVKQPLLVVPRLLSPVDIPVEADHNLLETAYGESKEAPTGKRLPIRKSFAPELEDSVMEQ